MGYAVDTGTVYQCVCGAIKDPEKSKRGTSSRRLGHDQERRIERVYGPRKVGEHGDAIDLIGRDFMWQSKATRDPMPAKWAALRDDEMSFAMSLVRISTPIEAMKALRSDRMPLLIWSWVVQGKPTRDIIVVDLNDWGNLHGWEDLPVDSTAATSGYGGMTGQYFLDVHGRDEP